MILKVGALRQRVFGLSAETINDFWKDCGPDTEIREQFRQIMGSFMQGYNTALELGYGPKLLEQLQSENSLFHSSTYEGAAMGLAMIDYTTPGKRSRLSEFVEQVPNYESLAYTGAGFAIAALNRELKNTLAPIKPMQRWWAVDGCGFYHGLFKWEKAVEQQWIPKNIKGYGKQVFDRGIGRSLWFKLGDNIETVAKKIQAFPEHRHEDLWSGVGVMSSYVGDENRTTLDAIKSASGCYHTDVAIGAIFAVTARYHAGNIIPHNELACNVYCGTTAEAGVNLALSSEKRLAVDPHEAVFATEPIFEAYREKIRGQFI